MSTANLAAEVHYPPSGNEQLSEPESTFIATSPSIRKLLDQARIVAPYLRVATVEGQSGSGKRTLARMLYRGYASRHPEIAESGFSSCDARDWLLSQTDPHSLAGFIFLDRVDLLATPGQELLLRTLKDLDFSQPGSLVLLASSESPLRELARSSQFLTELAMRLTSVRLSVPPLNERREDIVPLANGFLHRISARYRIQPVVLNSSAIACIIEYQWPGNVRELFSTLESAVIECSGNIIRAEDLSLPCGPAPASFPARPPETLNLDAVMHHHILRVLDMNHGNKLRTARQLGISRSTLYRLLEKRLTFSA